VPHRHTQPLLLNRSRFFIQKNYSVLPVFVWAGRFLRFHRQRQFCRSSAPAIGRQLLRATDGWLRRSQKTQALNKFTSTKIVERDGPPRPFSDSNAEPHLLAPQRLDPQDSRMDPINGQPAATIGRLQKRGTGTLNHQSCISTNASRAPPGLILQQSVLAL
jgi:hypothetical protein